MKGRAAQRGKPLEGFCKYATISKNEYGKNDNRCFCLGFIDLRTDDTLNECIHCGAYAMNAQPPKEET